MPNNQVHGWPDPNKTTEQVFASLLDEGQYHCSVRTMYRVLTDEHGDVKVRRRQVQRLNYTKH